MVRTVSRTSQESYSSDWIASLSLFFVQVACSIIKLYIFRGTPFSCVVLCQGTTISSWDNDITLLLNSIDWKHEIEVFSSILYKISKHSRSTYTPKIKHNGAKYSCVNQITTPPLNFSANSYNFAQDCT